MIKYTALVIIVALRLMYHPSYQQSAAPFTTPSIISASPVKTGLLQTAKLSSLEAKLFGPKVLLQWATSQNETADQFEVEKSDDGKNFVMAALVFGTDKNETDNYQYYEKATGKEMVYRIKLLTKEKKVEYSNIVIVRRTAS